MRERIINILENLQIVGILKEEDAVNISIYNETEYFDVADTNYKEAHELFGEFNYVLQYSYYTDYCFISKDMSISQVFDAITKWLQEIKLCSLNRTALEFINNLKNQKL